MSGVPLLEDIRFAFAFVGGVGPLAAEVGIDLFIDSRG